MLKALYKVQQKKKGNQYIINGEKWYVTSANKADFFFLQAKIKSGQ